MSQRALEHIAHDFHVAMPMCAETRARIDAILVDDAQRTEVHVFRILVFGKGKAVARMQPAMFTRAAFSTASDLYHLTPPEFSSSFVS